MSWRHIEVRTTVRPARLGVAWVVWGCSIAACTSLREPEPRVPAPSVAAPAAPTVGASQLDLPAELREPAPPVEAQATPVAVTAQDAPPPSVSTEPPAPVSPPEDEELGVLLRAHYVALGKREWTAFPTHFWSGATIVTIRQPQGGGPETVVAATVDDYVDDMRRLEKSGNIEFEVVDISSRQDGVVAYARVAYVARTIATTEPHPWRGVDVFLLVRHEGVWRIASLAFGSPTFDQ